MNPFDRFDPPPQGGNPFDRFDAQRQPQPTARAGEGFGDNGATWGGVQSAAHGAMQGLGDEIMAAIAGAKESFSGGLPFDQARDQALTMYRGARDQYREQSPGQALLTEGAGGLSTGIPAMMLGGAGLAAVPGVGRMAMPAATTAGRVAQYAGAGAAPAAVYGFNEGEGVAGDRAVEAGKSAAVGAATGMAVPAAVGAVGRVVQPVRAKLSDELSRLAAVAQQEGVPLSAAQQTGSRPLQIMESVFGNLPFTAGTRQAEQQAQRQAFNRAVLEKAGVNADNASPEVLDEAFKQIGGRFDDAAARTTVNIDQPFYDAVNAAKNDYGRRLPTDVAPVFQSYLDDIAAMQTAGVQPGVVGTTIPGEAFHNVYSNLRRAARNAKSRPELQEALNSLADSFDDAMARTGSNPGNLPAGHGTQTMATNPVDDWVAARRDYRNLLPVDRAMNSTTAAATAGDIPPTALAQAVRQQGGYSRGRGDLNDLARIGTAFVRDNVPDSGTAQRLFYQQLLTGGAGGLGYASTDDPVMRTAAIAASLGGPRAIQMAYNSAPVRNYLTNTAVTGAVSDQARRSLARLLAMGGGTIGGVQSQRP